MKVTNLDLSDEEAEILRKIAKKKGHDTSKTSPANLIRIALGFALRFRGGAREGTGPKAKQKGGK